MAKFHGIIGFLETAESREEPGVWAERITERKYRGDILSRIFRTEDSGKLNDNVAISNRLSIVADTFAKEHMGYMKYAVLDGFPWEIKNIEKMYPRIILTLGGVYNKPENSECDF